MTGMSRPSLCCLPALALLLQAAGAASAAGQEAPPGPLLVPLLVHYAPLPPRSYTAPDGQPAGTLIEQFRGLAEQAGLKIRLQETPLKRSLHEIEQQRAPLCALGAFRTPEREVWGRYSLALSADAAPLFYATPAQAPRLKRHASAAAVLADPALLLVLVDGVSYGNQLDALIAAAPRPPLRAGIDQQRMFRMLLAGRADYSIASPEELAHLVERGELPAAGLEAVRLPGMPEGRSRHLLCSKLVPEALLQRIDAALRTKPRPPAR